MSGNQQPQGHQNPISAFGLKPSTTSSTSNSSQSGGFGAFSSTPSLFGGAANPGQNNTTSTPDANTTPKAPLFGGGGFGSAPGSGGGIFGSGNAATSAGQTNNAFGLNTAPASGGLGFGNAGSGNTNASAAPNPLFGGAAGQPATPSTPSNPLFGGSTTPAAPAGGLFGSQPSGQTGNSTTATTTPSGNIFGKPPTSSTPLGGLFNSTNANKPSTSATTPSLGIFGASNNHTASGQNATAPASNSNTASSPSLMNPLFGNTANAPASNGNTASSPSLMNPPFGNTANAPSTSTPSQPSLFSGFGAKPSASSVPSTSAPALPSLFGGNKVPPSSGTGAPPPGTLFSNLPKKPETTGTLPSTLPASAGVPNVAAPKDPGNDTGKTDTPPAAPSLGGLFSRPAGSGDGKDQTKNTAANKDAHSGTSPTPVATFNLGGVESTAPKPTAAPGPVPAATASAAPSGGTAMPAPSMLRGKTVEDIVNRWTTELETHTREFSQFASEVAVWDRTLIENGNYISALYATVLAAESTQASLDQSLDHVEQQQRHLTVMLDQYEKSASEILHGPGGVMSSTEGLGLADSERDKSYALAATLYTQLDDLSRSLTQMVESVNDLNLSPGFSQGSAGTDGTSQEDAISTIAGILNAHLSSLQWIDTSLKEMDGKVKDTERKIKDNGARNGSRNEGTKSRSYGLGSSRR